MSKSTTTARTSAAVSADAGTPVAVPRRPATAPVSDAIIAANAEYIASLNLPPLNAAQAQLILTLAEAAAERVLSPAA